MEDAYIAYCVDEAGAWLLAQKDAPRYEGGGKKRSLNKDKRVLAALAQAGGMTVRGGESV